MKVVVVKERAAGNDYAGAMWTATAIFNDDATLAEVLAWAKKNTGSPTVKGATEYGRLMLTIPDEEPRPC